MRLSSLFCCSLLFAAASSSASSASNKYDVSSQIQDPSAAAQVMGILEKYVSAQERYRQKLLAVLGPEANVGELLEHAREYVSVFNQTQLPLVMARDVCGLMPQPIVNGDNLCFLISIMQCLGAVKGSVFSVPNSPGMPLLSKIGGFLVEIHRPRLEKPLKLREVVTELRQNSLLARYFNGGQMDAAEVLNYIYDILISEQPEIGNLVTWKEARETKDPYETALRISDYEPLHINFLQIANAIEPVHPEGQRRHLQSDIQARLEQALTLKREDLVNQLFARLEQLNATRQVTPTLNQLIEKYYATQPVDHMTSRLKRVGPLPAVYTVALKRFESDGYGVSGKIDTPVIIPEHLMLTSESFMDMKKIFVPSSKADYRLHAVIMHSGTLKGGHYISLVRLAEQWFLCDDIRITPASLQLIASGNCKYQGSTFTPYVLFYKRQ